jgi:MraZ protein
VPVTQQQTQQQQIWGEYERALDEKGRILIPPDLRRSLGKEFIITRGPEGSILVLPDATWALLERELKNKTLDLSVNCLKYILSSRMCAKLDPQNRLAVPKYLREWANIKVGETAIIVGLGSTVEIWSKPKWEDYLKTFTRSSALEAARASGVDDILF